MGISASATLAYGIDLGETAPWYQYDEHYEPVNPEFEDFDGEFEDYLAIKAGLSNPWDSMPEGYSYKRRDEFPEFVKASDEHRDAVAKLAKACPVRVETHGMPAYDYWAYAIVVNSDECYRSDYGDGAVDKKGLPREPTSDEIAAATEFCKEHGFGDFSEASWLLLTNVG